MSRRARRPLGGIGRRSGFKIHRPQGHIGSTPIEAIQPGLLSDLDAAPLFPPLSQPLRWRWHGAFLLALVLLTSLAYFNSFGAGDDRPAASNWTLDNKYIIALDPRIEVSANLFEPSTWFSSTADATFADIWTRDYWWPKGFSGLYRPIVTFSYWLNWRAGNDDRSRLCAFHAVNLIAHLVVAAEVYLLALQLIRRFAPAAGAALLFAVHPIATESVTNIIGRADLFAAISVLGALLLYLAAVRSRGVRKATLLLAMMAVVMLGLFSKESAVAIVLILLIYDFVFRYRPANFSWPDVRKTFWRFFRGGYFVLIPPLLLMAIVRWRVGQNGLPGETPFVDNPIRGVNPFGGALTACGAMLRLFWLLVWPAHLSCDYAFAELPVFPNWSSAGGTALIFVATVLLIGVVVYAFRARTRRPVGAFLILFALAADLPTSNLLITIGSMMAERFLYVPLVAFAIGLVLLLDWISRRASAARSNAIFSTGVACVLAIYVIRTHARNEDWRSDVTLWASANQAAPHSFRAYQSYAFALYEELNKPVAQRQPETKNVTIDDCIRVIEAGRPIVDDLPNRLNSSRLFLHDGMYHAIKGDAVLRADGKLAARPYFERAAILLDRAREIDEAFSALNRQRELERGRLIDAIPDVGMPQIYEMLGNVRQRLGENDLALLAYFRERHLQPLDAAPYARIAAVFTAMNQPQQAAISLAQSLRLDPRQPNLWPSMRQALAPFNQDAQPPIVDSSDGPQFNLQNPGAADLLRRAYLSFTRIFLESKMTSEAVTARSAAVERLGFAPQPFDAIFREFNVAIPATNAAK